MRRVISIFVILLTLLSSVSGQTTEFQRVTADTLEIRFMLDSINIDMTFGDNEATWESFKRNFNAHFGDKPAKDITIDIYSGASPEGSAAHNRWLGENRGNAIRRLIRRELEGRVGSIYVHNEAARWDGFYGLVAASNEPWRDEVLNIIERAPSRDENKMDDRELALRRLYGGKVWPTLLKRYLAPLRSGSSAIVRWVNKTDTIVVRDTIVIVNEGPAVVPVVPAADLHPTEKEKRKAAKDSLRQEYLKYPAWALKGNLLLWGIVSPNIQLEIPLGRRNRWSLEGNFCIPWWIWNDNAQAHQCLNASLEIRYWLGNRAKRRWLEGWHLGLAVAAGYYDFEWKKHEGYQGEHIMPYINVGYQLRWGKHWAFDFGVGVGAFFTKYRHYYGSSVYPQNHLTVRDDLLIWHECDNFQWFGPCHANISLVYMFNAWPFHTKSKKLNAKL